MQRLHRASLDVYPPALPPLPRHCLLPLGPSLLYLRWLFLENLNVVSFYSLLYSVVLRTDAISCQRGWVFFGDHSPHTRMLASFMSTAGGCVCPPHSEIFSGKALFFLTSTKAHLLHCYVVQTKTNKSLSDLIYNVAVFL